MTEKIFVRSALITLGLLAGLPAFAIGWYGGVTGGLGFTQVGASQQLTLNNTVSPNIVNEYSTDNTTQGVQSVGLDAGYDFTLSPRWQFGVGVEADYFNLGTSEGVVHPMVNLSSNFDTLNYSYDGNSYVGLFTTQIQWTRTGLWQPFVMAGVGAAYNELADYQETVPNGSTAQSAGSFGNHGESDFAYTLGVGAATNVNSHVDLAVWLRYVNLGDAELGTLPNQTTNEQLSSDRKSVV